MSFHHRCRSSPRHAEPGQLSRCFSILIGIGLLAAWLAPSAFASDQTPGWHGWLHVDVRSQSFDNSYSIKGQATITIPNDGPNAEDGSFDWTTEVFNPYSRCFYKYTAHDELHANYDNYPDVLASFGIDRSIGESLRGHAFDVTPLLNQAGNGTYSPGAYRLFAGGEIAYPPQGQRVASGPDCQDPGTTPMFGPGEWDPYALGSWEFPEGTVSTQAARLCAETPPVEPGCQVAPTNSTTTATWDLRRNLVSQTHPTATSVSCSPGSVSVGNPMTCTATVTDTASSGQTTPSETVSFTSDSGGSFGSGASCTLSGSGASSSCQLTYTPSAVGSGTHKISASYGGDTTHRTSSGNTNVTVVTVSHSACSDGLDNDGDGKIDYPADPGCLSATDNDETDRPACSDGLDNDGDGAVDWPNDKGCSSATDNSEAEPATLIIKKQTTPSNASTGFRFRLDGSYENLAFLHDTESLARSVSAGAHTVKEVPTSGWRVRGIVCDDSDSVGDPESATATFLLAEGETVRCVFENATDPWYPLVKTAIDQYLAVENLPSLAITRGFYNQILNIVCASARSPEFNCDPMKGHYAGFQWAGDGVGCTPSAPNCWIFNVFQDYLSKTVNPAQDAQEIERRARKGVEKICRVAVASGGLLAIPGRFACKLLARNSTDAGALYAGTIHFHVALDPSFREMTRAVISAHRAVSDLASSLAEIRSQHLDFINFAVLPGFDEVAAGGNLTGFGRDVAEWVVPRAANCFREEAIFDELVSVFGRKTGSLYYDQLTPQAEKDLRTSPTCKVVLAAA